MERFPSERKKKKKKEKQVEAPNGGFPRGSLPLSSLSLSLTSLPSLPFSPENSGVVVSIPCDSLSCPVRLSLYLARYLILSLHLSLSFLEQPRARHNLKHWWLNGVHALGEWGQTAPSWLGSAQLAAKHHRWRRWPCMRDSRPLGVARSFSGHFHCYFWVPISSSPPLRVSIGRVGSALTKILSQPNIINL